VAGEGERGEWVLRVVVLLGSEVAMRVAGLCGGGWLLCLAGMVAVGLPLAAGQGVGDAPGQARAGGAGGAENGERLPTLFLVGDSTMHPGGGAVLGGGDVIGEYCDKSRIVVENHALAGRSSRSFIDDPRGWVTVKPKLRKGDWVFIQFGHNDDEGSALNVLRFRFTLSGTGEEAGEFVVPAGTQGNRAPHTAPGDKVEIHTFGYYLREMIADVRAAGATPVLFSSVPRNRWENGKIVRGEERHGPWTKEVAGATKVAFVDLNEKIAEVYDPLNEAKVKALFFTAADNTHTSPNGARVSAACGVLGLLEVKGLGLEGFMVAGAGEKARGVREGAGK
jgi:lysophospholipase L1-like esterase